jgi:hypothetical protein
LSDGGWSPHPGDRVRGHRALDEADRVAERAARSQGDTRAVRIIARLLEDDPEPWDVERIGARGLEVLSATTDNDAAADLRERLLERGFYDAKDA